MFADGGKHKKVQLVVGSIPVGLGHRKERYIQKHSGEPTLFYTPGTTAN